MKFNQKKLGRSHYRETRKTTLFIHCLGMDDDLSSGHLESVIIIIIIIYCRFLVHVFLVSFVATCRLWFTSMKAGSAVGYGTHPPWWSASMII